MRPRIPAAAPLSRAVMTQTADPTNAPSPGTKGYLRALFESLPMAVLVSDGTGRQLDANAAACRLLGRERDELVGKTLADFLVEKHPGEMAVLWESFLRDGERSGFTEFRLPGGGTRTMHFHAVADFVPGYNCAFLTPMRGEQAGEADDLDALTMCAWTRRVQFGGEWVTVEKYLLTAHGQAVTHGISPDAFEDVGTKPK